MNYFQSLTLHNSAKQYVNFITKSLKISHSVNAIEYTNTPNENSFREHNHHDAADGIDIDCLDCMITVEEVIKTISNISRHKSSDLSGNVADFFIDCKDFISQYLAQIFSYIFYRGVYPDA